MRLMGIAAAAAAVLLLAGCSAQPSGFTTKGKFAIIDSGDSITNTGSVAGCYGSGGYSDIAQGTDVTIYDAAGKIIATGQLSKGKMNDGGGACVFPFTVQDVPAGKKFYQVEVSHRGKLTEKEKDLRKGIVLTLGSQD